MQRTSSGPDRVRSGRCSFGSLASVLGFWSLLAATAAAQLPAVSWLSRQMNPRDSTALAYDTVRQRAVLFGGSTGHASLSDTWEWDGTGWAQRTPATSPPARSGHALAYDIVRQRTVLFGGYGSASLPLADTWEWDGSSWALRTPIVSPPARTGHALAYDIVRQRTVLFGGYGGSSLLPLADTWEWNGTNWAQLAPATSPSLRGEHALAYDYGRQKVVLFGGHFLNAPLSDTWEWDGSNWTQLFPLASPPARGAHAMAYDLPRRRVVLFGGQAGNVAWSDTWEWDGNNWTQRAPATSPPARAGHVLTYDLVRNRSVLVGGVIRGIRNARLSDTWEWDGNSWALRAPATSPAAAGGHAMVYDSGRQRVVLFGGYYLSTTTQLSETWEWDGGHWTQGTPLTSPAARSGHGLAYDAARQSTVLFGGFDGSVLLSDTWEWNGQTWLRRSPGQSPSARSTAMAYDSARSRVVLFGGSAGSSGNFAPLSDTWEWDGSNWTQRAPTASPPARYAPVLAYDVARRRTVLFGGMGATSNLSDTWEWDGSNWTRLTPTSSPSARTDHALTYDSARQRIVLVGGWGSSLLTDTWEWDGSNWTSRPTPTGPLPRFGPALAYDAARQRVVLTGGSSTPEDEMADTWVYGPLTTAATQPLGTGCSGTAVPPVLATNEPYLGNAAFTLDLLGARASSACLFGLAGSSQNLSIGGGCTLYLKDPIFPLFAVTNSSGFAAIVLSVPLDPSLRGATLYAQALVADPLAPIGFAFTGGRTLVLGD